ncbi:MAG: hypothetical protein VR67_18515 [Peptococcaceae bacterium BRH_c8a]|nr:MAG: hypothetical protein VR67_18515 [Peptococcaceae bacterium BRH_c8a]
MAWLLQITFGARCCNFQLATPGTKAKNLVIKPVILSAAKNLKDKILRYAQDDFPKLFTRQQK